MKIKKLTIENFQVIGNAVLNLDTRGLLLVQGQNDDDTSANSNGAGKSTLVDAISWCLYDQTARDESGDNIINNKVGKNCMVKLLVDDAGTEYEITRYRKHSKGKNDLVVVKDPNLPTKNELTKGTKKLSQEVVDKIMGCTYEIFIAAIYCGQETMPNLPGKTDKELKLIVEESSGIEVLQKAYEVALLKSTSVKKLVDAKTNALNLVISKIDSKKAEIADLEINSSEFIRDKNEELEVKTRSLALDEDAFESLTKMAESSRVGQKVNHESMQATKEKIDETQTTEKAELAIHDDKVKALEKNLSEINIEIRLATDCAKKSKASLDTVNERVGTPCGECGKEYHEDDIADAKINATTKLKAELITLKNFKEQKEAAEKRLNIALTERKEFINTKTDIRELLSEYELFKERFISHEDIINQEINAQTKLNALKSVVEKIKSDLVENIYEKMISSKRLEISGLDEERESVTTDLLKLKGELEIAEAAVEVFGRAGVRAHILDTVTPFLNERTSEYISTLTDGNITAEWSTISKTAKGELREKFGITVDKYNGSQTFKGLSGGEKRKVRLATSMALSDLVASRATKPIEFLLCDEIDDALDVSGLERLMIILEQRGKEKGTVLIISHNSLSEWCPNMITVKNTGGISEVIDEI